MRQRWSLNETQSELAQVEHPLLRFSVRKSTTTTIIAYFQPSVRLIIPETSLSLNSKQDDINEVKLLKLFFLYCELYSPVSCN